MLNIFDIANVDVFIEKSGDNSVIGSWNRIKKEIEELGTTPNNAIMPCAHDWFLIENEHVHGVDVCTKCRAIKAHTAQ